MHSILVAWIGRSDLDGPAQDPKKGPGPIASALTTIPFDRARFIYNYPQEQVAPYLEWLATCTSVPFTADHVRLSGGPTSFPEIYKAAADHCRRCLKEAPEETRLTMHLSPGTGAMTAVWILLGKSRFPADFVESSIQQGARRITVPFNIASEVIPDLLRDSDRRLGHLSNAGPPVGAAFRDIHFCSDVMRRVVARAQKVAIRSIPVLIEGESGTGKELFARAIHDASPRSGGRFIALNCGAIPENLVESELFGYKKGAFTGADKAHVGVFEEATDGTLFLDEIGELPLQAQVKLLRVLQEETVSRIGETKSIKVNVRIIAATNRSLVAEVQQGRFRSDLYYRLAVAVLDLPPLRDREGDLGLLIDHLTAMVNDEASEDPTFEPRTLTIGARSALMSHTWPGNVREMINVLRRCILWGEGDEIDADDVRDAVVPLSGAEGRDPILDRPLGDGFDLRALLAEVSRSYITRALKDGGGVKKRAAEALGFENYQTLSGWIRRLRIED